MTTVQGFDSRYWKGVVPPGFSYKFAAFKATEGDYFANHLFPVQMDAIAGLALPRLAWHYHRQRADVKGAARIFHRFCLPDMPELPPVLDCEDRSVNPNPQMARTIWDTLQEIEQRFGRECIVYSAAWYWDRWVRPWTTRDHLIYTRMLWEADPPPDTKEPGYFGKPVITQVRLDWIAPAFGGDKIDVDEADDAWLTQHALYV
jgi:hypothetical protein